MKLKSRVTLLSAVGCVGLLFLLIVSILQPSSIDEARGSLYRGANSHLMAPRNLVDKSSWAISNFTSADYQFHDEPVRGQKVSSRYLYSVGGNVC